MSFSELIQKRYSCRAYRPDPVEEEKLLKVLNAARMAPSATNLQPYQFIVLRSQGHEADLRRIYYHEWFVQAPVVICACALPSASWQRGDGKRYGDVDVAIAMDHLTLAATELGLGTCWIASFEIKAVREILGIPYGVEPVAFTPLGYPADEPGPKERKDLSELVRYDHW
ncbi:MAG: nitroreductase [Chloroflexi bacterium]|nr:nitroreductase [Chloroflexota bacterium]